MKIASIVAVSFPLLITGKQAFPHEIANTRNIRGNSYGTLRVAERKMTEKGSKGDSYNSVSDLGGKSGKAASGGKSGKAASDGKSGKAASGEKAMSKGDKVSKGSEGAGVPPNANAKAKESKGTKRADKSSDVKAASGGKAAKSVYAKSDNNRAGGDEDVLLRKSRTGSKGVKSEKGDKSEKGYKSDKSSTSLIRSRSDLDESLR